MEKLALIMAGGSGTRFWPLSRYKRPKQYLKLFEDKFMINDTIERLHDIIEMNNVYIITSVEQQDILKEILISNILRENIIFEPDARNTTSCIALASVILNAKYKEDVIVCVFPADHYVKDINQFKKTINKAIEVAEKENGLVTIGIKPQYACTGYGYIELDRVVSHKEFYKVKKFVEKPDYNTAFEYLKTNNYLWNSGIFIWKLSTILSEFEMLQPQMFSKLKFIINAIGTQKEAEVIKKIYPQFEKLSIDYGIMEKSENVFAVPGDFGWSDVGSWEALETFYTKDNFGNVVVGDNVVLDTKNSVVYSENHTIATLGVEDIIIVHTDDATLICHKDKSQNINEILLSLKKKGDNKLL